MGDKDDNDGAEQNLEKLVILLPRPKTTKRVQEAYEHMEIKLTGQYWLQVQSKKHLVTGGIWRMLGGFFVFVLAKAGRQSSTHQATGFLARFGMSSDLAD